MKKTPHLHSRVHCGDAIVALLQRRRQPRHLIFQGLRKKRRTIALVTCFLRMQVCVALYSGSAASPPAASPVWPPGPRDARTL